MNIDVEFVAKVIGVLAVIAGAVGSTYKAIIRHLDKHLDAKLAPLTKWTQNQQTDINDGAERDAIMMEAQLASMEAIHEGKNNGNVTGAISKLQQYMFKQSNKPSSYAKE